MGKVYYYKGSEILTPFTIRSNEPHFDMTTISLRTQRANQGHQRWELSFNTVYTEDSQVDGLLDSIVGLNTTDTMIMPQLNAVSESNTLTADPVVASTASSGSNQITLDITSALGSLPKGSFFKFYNSSFTYNKIYIVTENLNMTGSSNVLLKFYPNLRQEIVANSTVKTGDDVLLTYFRNIDNDTGITFTDGVLSDIGTISLFEAL